MTYKHLFQRALAAAPDRLHFAAHSHHLWPDASWLGQQAAWEDGVRLADHKWGRVMGEILPAAQRHVADELRLPDPSSIVFAGNTHDLLLRIVSARSEHPVRILTSDGEFHSFRRQSQRWLESGRVTLDVIPNGEGFAGRFLAAARTGGHDLVFVSQVMFETGAVFAPIADLADLARPGGPWVVIDGYHGFMAIENDLSGVADRIFYLAGGYKYAMAGEGAAFLHCPPGFGPRPEITGWYAEFADLEKAPGRIGYAADAMRFMGSTFDPSGLYRFVAVRDMLAAEGITTATVNAHIAPLRDQLLAGIAATPLSAAQLLNPGGDPHARFLALRSPHAPAWKTALEAQDIVTDVRGDVLRIGFGLYHDQRDVRRLLAALGDI
ncbi:aminotransferase class V-fold PLP-dependent enzyme [Sphingomonas sp.]|uniref:aminotransferase class V-fold PLP-dependent enzyme n=1 Tax=Sphingomonas sp. TaxID=28214 RepID=UPI0031DBF1A1